MAQLQPLQSPVLEYIDERTKLIINGYIHDAKKLLRNSILKDIPEDINFVTLSYVDDHFMMHRGSYQWEIKDTHHLQQVLSSPTNFCFNSNVFEMSKCQYILQLYPNGNNHLNLPPGDVAIFAKILSIPSKWRRIMIQQSIICHETNTKYHCVQNYHHYEQS